MTVRIYVDGTVVAPEAARIPVFDRGFLYGDSIYETMRTAGGRVVDLDRHLDRLGRSGYGIALELPEEDLIRGSIAMTLEAARNEESSIRLMVTRGEGQLGLDPALAGKPRLVVIVQPLKLPETALYENGIALAVVETVASVRAASPMVKSGNYLKNVLALGEARRQGAHEAVLRGTAGEILEGASSNLFVVVGGKVLTPPLQDGLLDGITRRRVMELAKELQIPLAETRLYEADLQGAQEIFVTSSIRGVLPAARIDGRDLPAAPGPISHKLMEAYAAFLAKVSQGQLS